MAERRLSQDAAPAGAARLQWLDTFRPVLQKYAGLFIGTVLAGVAMHGCSIAIAGVGALVVGKAVLGTSIGELVPWLWLLLGLAIPLVIFPWLETTLAHIFAFRVLADLRVTIYDAFERLAPGYMLENRSGDLGTAVMGDVELLELGFSHTLPPLFVALVVPAGVLYALAAQHGALAVTIAPFIACGMVVPILLERYGARTGRRVRHHVGETGGEAVDAIQGLREILAFGAEDLAVRRLKDREKGLYQAQVAHGRTKAWQLGADHLLAGLATTAVVAVASFLVARGEVERDMLPVCVTLGASIFLPLHTLMEAGRDFPSVFSAMQRIHAILTANPTVRDDGEAQEPPALSSEIRFEQVGFRYRPHLSDALHEINFAIRPGEVVALVGHSGAGKSTCANLLLRLWDVTRGRITIGGIDIRLLPQEYLRRLIAYVPQDVYLFNCSVEENIRLCTTAESFDQVRQAATAAQAADFIDALPDGWQTPIGERGIFLSGGQRQRLAIARAILKDAPILVLDEAASNLDVESEFALRRAIAELAHKRTTLIIAHRLSTIKSADRVVVLEQGRVVEIGTHRDLIARQGVYARLIASDREMIVR